MAQKGEKYTTDNGSIVQPKIEFTILSKLPNYKINTYLTIEELEKMRLIYSSNTIFADQKDIKIVNIDISRLNSLKMEICQNGGLDYNLLEELARKKIWKDQKITDDYDPFLTPTIKNKASKKKIMVNSGGITHRRKNQKSNVDKEIFIRYHIGEIIKNGIPINGSIKDDRLYENYVSFVRSNKMIYPLIWTIDSTSNYLKSINIPNYIDKPYIDNTKKITIGTAFLKFKHTLASIADESVCKTYSINKINKPDTYGAYTLDNTIEKLRHDGKNGIQLNSHPKDVKEIYSYLTEDGKNIVDRTISNVSTNFLKVKTISNKIFSNCTFEDNELENITFINVKFVKCTFSMNYFKNITFKNCQIIKSYFEEGYYEKLNLGVDSDSKLSNSLEGTVFNDVVLLKPNLEDVDLLGTTFVKTDLDYKELDKAKNPEDAFYDNYSLFVRYSEKKNQIKEREIELEIAKLYEMNVKKSLKISVKEDEKQKEEEDIKLILKEENMKER